MIGSIVRRLFAHFKSALLAANYIILLFFLFSWLFLLSECTIGWPSGYVADFIWHKLLLAVWGDHGQRLFLLGFGFGLFYFLFSVAKEVASRLRGKLEIRVGDITIDITNTLPEGEATKILDELNRQNISQ
jgi:hypothetical protein